MNTKQKAQEIIDKYKPYVYPYMGSGFMTNTEDESVILSMSKICAKIALDEILSIIDDEDSLYDYYLSVKLEIDNL